MWIIVEKDSLIVAVIAFQRMERFNETVANSKEVIGDLACAEKIVGEYVND